MYHLYCKENPFELTPVFKYFFPVFLLSLFIAQSAGAQALHTDSLRAVQKHRSDSLRAVQQHRSDSLAAIRAYRNSKQYKDSVTASRQHRIDSIKDFRKRVNDSLMQARQHTNDSMLAVRKHYNDSLRASMDSIRLQRQQELEQLRAERKQVSDSLARIREYRESKPYKDSLLAVRQQRKDSMIAVRKRTTDSLRAVQQARTDSMKLVRQKFNDSLHAALDSMKLVRQKQLDSMGVVRQARKDSLAKLQADRELLRGKKKEEREKKKQLAFELKVKKKQDAYSNEKMRKKKWTLPRKVVQNTFTRYNYFFNADKKMDEAIANMIRSRQDNYDSLIPVFPFNPDLDSARLASDMDTIISKASVGIQIHDPRAKWQDDLYLLVGQAYFYKADYENAAAAFKSIVAQAEQDKKDKAKRSGNSAGDKHKPVSYSDAEKTGLAAVFTHTPAKNEAMLWLARTFTQSKKEGQAQTLLDMLNNDVHFPEHLKGRLALEQAFVDLMREDHTGAIAALITVSKDKELPDWLRLRASFLSGQLLQVQGDYANANKSFEQNIDLHPELDMEFYARKNIAFNNLKGSGNTAETKAFLAEMAGEGKFRPFYDQIYFTLAQAELKEGHPDAAMENFKKSLQFNQNNKKQKGYTFAAIGDEYYKLHDYRNAKSAYDSASFMLTPSEEPVYTLALQRSRALDQIAAPAYEQQQQDSLIRLAVLSEQEQRAVIKKYLRDLEKQREDSVFKAQNAGQAPVATNLFNNQSSQSWYFANPAQMQQGKNEFLQKWGNRPLADNWRRSARFSAENNIDSDIPEQNDNAGLPDADSLYAAIPRSPEQLAAANEKLQEAIFQLGKGYYTYLEDYANASVTFDTLDKRFPAHPHQAEVLYTRYLMAMRQNEPDVAARYNSGLQSRFPDSEWARLLRQARDESPARNPEAGADTSAAAAPELTISDYYDETYNLLTERQYDSVIRRADVAVKRYPVMGGFNQKFSLMKAIATAGSGRYPEADSMLTAFIKVNSNDSLSAWATSVLNYIRGQKEEGLNKALANTAADSMKPDRGTGPGDSVWSAPYTFEPAHPHYVILVAAADMRIFALKAGLLDFNAMRNGKEKEEINITMTTLDAGRNIIVCREFKDGAGALLYLKDIRKNPNLFREYPKQDYSLIVISGENYARLTNKKDFEEYKKFYNKYYR